MVDFGKRLAHKHVERPLSPIKIYETLDRASDKGPLRPAQVAVLEEWHTHRRSNVDVVLKLHTGEGKTLVGLLILQSKLNEHGGRSLYLCPNHFLVDQTLNEARAFGINAIPVDDDGELPSDFLDGKAILVAPVQKLFNGRSKFALGANAVRVDTIVLDDAHAGIDAIRDASVISLDNAHPGYEEIVSMFATDLEDQGAGTFAEMRQDNDSNAFLPVPYWSWIDRHRDTAKLLARHVDSTAVKFAWPLLRDRLDKCQCVVSARGLVIAPFRPPLELFGSFASASQRVFMSATLTDDSFLVKGFGIRADAIEKPLTNTESKWSGEKMVLLPSIIHDSLTSTEIVELFAKPLVGRRYGIVVLVPSREASKQWASAGATVATRDDIDEQVERLRSSVPGSRDDTVVIVNRYDGIDLPDSACRVLVLDGKPFGEALLDKFLEACRPGSELIAARIARVIEQGMGRAVRGEKDYCVVVLTRGDLVKAVRTKEGRAHLSEQTRTQIEIGLDIAAYGKEEMSTTRKPLEVLKGLINQSLKRDDGWKAFYAERMSKVRRSVTPPRMLPIFTTELNAELEYERGHSDAAAGLLQALVDKGENLPESDKAWYLQEIARYQYSSDKAESARVQAAAHQRNRYLLKPRNGVQVRKLAPIGEKRIERIRQWVAGFESFEALAISVEDLISSLRFGVRADTFEKSLDDLASALGFPSERPDKEWKAGPDNLWGLKEGDYLLVECKSEVATTRAEISRSETGQLNNAVSWFAREYPGAKCTSVLVIPTRTLGRGAGFNQPTQIMRAPGLATLTRNTRAFFQSFKKSDMRDISDTRVQSLLEKHQLGVEAIKSAYFEEPRPAERTTEA